jgi:glucokinase
MDEQYAVGVDLGGTNVRTALVSRQGRIRCAEARRSDLSRGPAALMDEMAELVQRVIEQGAAAPDGVVGIGVGSPGPLSPSRGLVFKAANLPGWKNVELRRGITERTGRPTIIDNDANLAAYGEFWAGAGKGADNIVMLTLGTGIGAGVVINGELLHGHFENAAELGHTIVVPNGRVCSCGQRGCLEQYASASSVARRVVEGIKNGESSILAGMVARNEPFGSRKVVEAAQDGDALASRIWDEACYFLAIACANIQHAFNPQRIVLSGGMSKAGSFLTELVQKHFELLSWNLHDDFPEIAVAELGDDAGVIGAAGWAWKAADEGRWEADAVC